MEEVRNQKECQYCRQTVLKIKRKCPFCKNYLYPNTCGTDSPNKERNQEMVKMLEKGSTLEEVGGKYNITRERVRQLYQACTKHPYTELVRKRIQIKKIRKDEELKKQKKIVVFYCRDCSKPVRYLEEKHSHQQIICRSCWKQWRAEGRAWDKVNICEKCGKKFHPHVNMRSQKFCSQECYTAHGRGRHLIMPVVSSIFRINGRIINHA